MQKSLVKVKLSYLNYLTHCHDHSQCHVIFGHVIVHPSHVVFGCDDNIWYIGDLVRQQEEGRWSGHKAHTLLLGGEIDLLLGGETDLLLKLVLLPAWGLHPLTVLLAACVAVAHPCQVFFAVGEVFLFGEATQRREVFLSP